MTFFVAGLVAEAVSGERWDDLIQRRIFDPLGWDAVLCGSIALAGGSDSSVGYLTAIGLTVVIYLVGYILFFLGYFVLVLKKQNLKREFHVAAAVKNSTVKSLSLQRRVISFSRQAISVEHLGNTDQDTWDDTGQKERAYGKLPHCAIDDHQDARRDDSAER